MLMLKIRLARIGRKNDPSYRVVVTEHARGPQAGKNIEVLGNYNPRLNTLSLEGERITYWIGKGAQASDTVHNLLVSKKIIEGKKINVLPRKSPIVKEGGTAEAKTLAPETEKVSEAKDTPPENMPEKQEKPKKEEESSVETAEAPQEEGIKENGNKA